MLAAAFDQDPVFQNPIKGFFELTIAGVLGAACLLGRYWRTKWKVDGERYSRLHWAFASTWAPTVLFSEQKKLSDPESL